MDTPELLAILAPRPFHEFSKILMGENITLKVVERLLHLEKQRGFRWEIGMRPRKAWLVRLHRRCAALSRIRAFGTPYPRDWRVTPAEKEKFLWQEKLEKEALLTFIERYCRGNQRKKVGTPCP